MSYTWREMMIAVTTSKPDLRLLSAVIVGKLAGVASRRLGIGGGTSLPGALARRVDPATINKLISHLHRGTVLVTGTNGKTTTSRILAAILANAGWQPVHNRAGANLASGLATALVTQAGLVGQSGIDSGLFEVDEAVFGQLLSAISPRVVVLTNLFRDQLDRYGEIDLIATRWRQALQAIPPTTTVVLNADDPAVAALGQAVSTPVLYYGIDSPGDRSALDHVADSRRCPFCGAPLTYDVVRYAHLGQYRCPSSDFARPKPDVVASSVVLRGTQSTEVVVNGPFGSRSWRFGLPGLYNVYNLLAAVAGSTAAGIPVDAVDATVARFSAAFGRLEQIQVGDRTLFLALIKNPVGFTEVLRTILADSAPKDFAFFINDNLADGTDVSWLWDAQVEIAAEYCRSAIVSGTRAGDMAVRLKYAGVPAERIQIIDSIEKGLDVGLARLGSGETLYVLPTYTAMLELRTIVSRRHYANHFWDD